MKRLVTQLDLVPEQVHTDVLILEHSMGDELTVGVEMVALDVPSSDGSIGFAGASHVTDGDSSIMSSVQNGVFPRGLTLGVTSGVRVGPNGELVAGIPGLISIDAMKRDSRFRVLSRTSLESQDNREATVNIVNEIPVLKSTVEGGSGSARDVIQNIERIEVGVKMKIVPHVILPGREIRMELNPKIEAVVDSGPDGAFAPTIARREVSTTVTVRENQTIVIAGLTREDQREIKRRIPVLGAIPLLGVLFRHNTTVKEKTNILILLTPRIVTDRAAADAVLKEWTEQTGLQVDDGQ